MMKVYSMRRKLRKIVLILITLTISLYVLAPVVWTFITSISTEAELIVMPKHWIPNEPIFDRYYILLTGKLLPGYWISMAAEQFLTGVRNSLVVALSVMVTCVFLGSLAGFAFSKLRFPMKQIFFLGLFGLLAFPYITLMPSLFFLYHQLGLLDTHLGLIILHLSWTLPLSVGIMSAYIDTIHTDLIKAARIDGCSWLDVYFRIILPLSAPGLIAVAIITFLFSWNEFLGALCLTSTIQSKTFPIILAEFQGLYRTDYGSISAGAIIGIIPAILIALIFQKYIVKGLALGAVRG